MFVRQNLQCLDLQLSCLQLPGLQKPDLQQPGLQLPSQVQKIVIIRDCRYLQCEVGQNICTWLVNPRIKQTKTSFAIPRIQLPGLQQPGLQRLGLH